MSISNENLFNRVLEEVLEFGKISSDITVNEVERSKVERIEILNKCNCSTLMEENRKLTKKTEELYKQISLLERGILQRKHTKELKNRRMIKNKKIEQDKKDRQNSNLLKSSFGETYEIGPYGINNNCMMSLPCKHYICLLSDRNNEKLCSATDILILLDNENLEDTHFNYCRERANRETISYKHDLKEKIFSRKTMIEDKMS